MLQTLGWLAALGLATANAAGREPVEGRDPQWHASLAWQGQAARVESAADGGWLLRSPTGTRHIAPQRMASDTASPLFDGLFAMAQAEMEEDKVDAITDWSFNHQQPFPCACFETGEKWHYVWTRDLSYAADLALARLDPERTKTSLRFKLSGVRAPGVPKGLYVAQDTGSGGSWPISTDRVVWFLAARHLLDDRAFADETWRALVDTLAQDRAYAFDESMGLYRGETSFLDWREQNYPAWTAKETAFIAQSFALSTNVLHYEALRLAARLAEERGDADAARYAGEADALKAAVGRHFWREDRGLYMSYLGTAQHPVPFEAYDLLGLSLAIDSGVAPPERARRALANYPATEAGSPVIWPQQPGTAIYHNRAIWPFVSAYALRAARKVGDPTRIAHELRSLMRGAALSGSNMENYELTTQAVHVEDGKFSGPVVNSPRQLWSVAAYLDMVMRGVFGLEDDGRIAPQLPAELVPMLFGEREAITLHLPARDILLRRPGRIDGNLLVAGVTRTRGRVTTVELVATQAQASALRMEGARFAPSQPSAPVLRPEGNAFRIAMPAGTRLYVDGARHADAATAETFSVAKRDWQQCFSLTRVDPDGIESLHSPATCTAPAIKLEGAWPRTWSAPRDGHWRAVLRYANANGPINTGITAAVKTLVLQCEGQPRQAAALVMPHREGEGDSTVAMFAVRAGVPCRFTLEDGFNMSYLAHFAHYTG
ncbi:MAG TPA: Six-hairpin glycosidase-like protein, partial [Lysobacter sp.]|nr:Six-hairpin glycosidase-like protein [Lysobacter sp.]